MGNTTALRQALKAMVYPRLQAQGFVIDQRRQPVSTTFRRARGERVDLLDLQWDKYGRPRFVLHAGTCPATGLMLATGLLPAADALPTWCADAATLKPRRGTGTRAWFRQDATLPQRLLGRPRLRPPEAVVAELLALLPELGPFWDSGRAGPHLWRWRLAPAPREIA
jgi:hypothetical protein